ncbi:EVE domain-containing protein [Rhodohalobacter sulfatireducens]|uniref:EVE domain-containing protein n=1 Tax=Rhodohalobacter sulfatireducens TaxID=2911366 RepID=A0ABS9KDU7_9BACT|nr:EVE domain-containing protein [Rhodohalobacter sulfatireducens]MCG2589037.1 EVE domain-containing protein [Rhodohalobacter sulfatireducens]MDR9365964.1 EVE domain-containing protein [Balneolaceae bacterium]
MSTRQYWLMKSEPYAYSIDDLEKDGVTPWDGVRNYAARNYMRDEMNVGDRVLFYHSNVRPPVIAGIMEVCSEPYPDQLQFDPESKYFDEKSSEEDPTWQLVDVKFVEKFDKPVTRDELKEVSELDDMELFRLNRVSITPVREHEYKKILEMAEAKEN